MTSTPARWRRSLVLFAASATLSGMATGAWVLSGAESPDAAQAIGWLLAAVLAGFGIGQIPGSPRHASGQARTLVDGLIVATSALFVAWLVGVRDVYTGEAAQTLALGAALLQVAVGAGAIVILTRARVAARWSLAWVAAGLTAMAAAAGCFAYLTLAPAGALVAGLLAGWSVACLALLPVADRQPSAEADQVEPGLPNRASVFIPSVPFAVAVVAAAIAGVRGEFEGFLVADAAAIIVLIVARQILALLENIGFWRRLEAKVSSRTEELRRNEARFRSLVQHSSDVITVLDESGEISYQSPSTRSVFGYEPAEIEGPARAELIHEKDLPRAIAAMRELVGRPGACVSVDGRVRHSDGSWRHVEAIATNLLHDPAVAGLVINTRDITERKQLEHQLTYRAFHDPLTSLANRALFTDRLRHALSRQPGHGEAIAVLFLDLDEFKNVNDSLGHGCGDAVLAKVAERLVGCLRQADTVARFGGDEFAILVEDTRDPLDAARAAERILAALHSPIELDGRSVPVRASIGVAMSPQAGTTAEDMLRSADVAMYAAKMEGKGGYQFFEPSMQAGLLERLELEGDLRTAVERGELLLEYQPIVSLEGESVQGVEALVRWRHPTHGVLPPDRFIRLAEERGLMGSIGAWVLRAACQQAQLWQRRSSADGLKLIVNLSAIQLERAGLVEDVRLALAESGLDPASLVIEITESVVLESDTAIAKLKRVRDLGVRVSVDDFGTGYSSLSYLRRLPLDILKIDRSFIEGLAPGSSHSAIVEAILAMSESLGIAAVAEGVERAEQVEELRRLGCELAQGFYFCRPVSADRVAELLAASPPQAGRGVELVA